MQEYVTIYAPAEDEFVERKSRFIGAIAPVQTEEEAQAWIAQVRQQHRDATHNTYAYILRNGIKRYSAHRQSPAALRRPNTAGFRRPAAHKHIRYGWHPNTPSFFPRQRPVLPPLSVPDECVR